MGCWCRQVFQGRTDSVCDEVLEAIKLKLKIRTKIGLYELIETFKHFTEEGKTGITFNQVRHSLPAFDSPLRGVVISGWQGS